jgi:spoIIIJ-associated protein
MDKQIIDYIMEVITGTFKYWPLTAEVNVSEEENFVRVNLTTNKDHLFVQPSAEPLLAVQHIVRLMVKNKFPEAIIHLSVNIGDFHERQKDALIALAESAMERVKKDGTPVYLPPMSSFERRIVHMHLADNPTISSESIGNEPNRRLVVKSAS